MLETATIHPPIEELNLLTLTETALHPPSTGKYANILSQKSPWDAPTFAKSPPMADQYKTLLQRCLALALLLEVPVGIYALEASKRELSNDQRYTLINNSKDEIRHYAGFYNYVQRNPLSEEDLSEAQSFLDWLENSLEHPVVNAACIEIGLFFPILAMIRRYADPALRNLGQEINRDERTHVLTNWSIIKDKSITYDKACFKKFCHNAIDWIIPSDHPDTNFDRDKWLRVSNNLLTNQYAPELDYTRTAVIPSPLETSATSVSKYS